MILNSRFLLVLFIILLGTDSFAKKWDKYKCPSDKALAKDFLELEVTGWRVFGIEDKCLNKKKFLNFEVGDLSVNEINKPDFYTAEKKPYKILKIKKISKYKREVFFEVKKLDKSGRSVLVKDSFKFVRRVGVSKKRSGCAGVIVDPKNLFVKKSCYKK